MKLAFWISFTMFFLALSHTSSVSATIMDVIPHKIPHLGGVFVYWSHVSHPNTTDKIGYYCPADRADDDPLDMVSPPTTSTNGVLFIGPLLNIRQECQFRYLRHNGSSYYSDGNSSVLSFHQTPLHIRLSVTQRADEMVVMWISDTTTPTPYVIYKVGNKTFKIEANSTTYAASDMCEYPATSTLSKWFLSPGWIHRAVMTHLPPDTRVTYQVGNDNIRSSVLFFRTPHPTKLQAFILADLGEWVTPLQGYAVARSQETIRNVFTDFYNQTQDYRLLVHSGDISYARGKAYQWEQFAALVEPISTVMPYMVSIGNHEYDHETDPHHKDPSGAGSGWHPSWGNFGTDSAGECGLPVVKRFSVPDNGNSVFWYSYSYGPSRWIHFSSEHDYTPSSKQYEWLNKTFSSVDRSVTPWVFVVAHRPMYCSLNNIPNTKVMYAMQQYLEDMFYHYKVDVFWTGHYHAYERTCPVYRGKCQEWGGITHLMTGMAGASLDKSEYFYAPWSAYHDSSSYGYGRLHIYNKTHTYFEYVANANTTVKDSIWIVKND